MSNETLKLALAATDKILANLRDSDFVSMHGHSPVDTLISYRLDIAGDIFESFVGRPMNEAETTAAINEECPS